MTLEQYMKEDDSNKFWRLSSGEHENLLDEAIEKMERYEKALKVIKQHVGEIGRSMALYSTTYNIASRALE